MAEIDAQVMAELLRRAAAAWPYVQVTETRFQAGLARAVQASGVGAEALHTSDLYLALACLDGQSEALAAFEEHIIGGIRLAVARSARTAADVEDALQTTRERLFVAVPPEPPKLALYTGRGSLVAWVRVVAIREVLQAHRRTKREVAGDDAALVTGVTSLASQELAFDRGQHADAFRAAVQQALRRLTAEQRTLLRFATRDGLTIDQLAPMLGVHRATAARRLERARADALDATHAILCESGLSASEARSLCVALAGDVDVSIGRALDGDP